MATDQRRWLCRDCHREWLDVSETAMGCEPWTPDKGCPRCRSAAIEERRFQPTFPGGDIPRAAAPAIPATVDDTTEKGTLLRFVAGTPLVAQHEEERDDVLVGAGAGIPEFE